MINCVAIWDTGATSSVITRDVVQRCGLKPTGMVKVHGVGGEEMAETYLVNIGLMNGVLFPNMTVTLGKLPAGSHALIGMDIISNGDFAVSNFQGRTSFTFRCPSVALADFVPDSNVSMMPPPTGISRGGISGGKQGRKRHK